MRRSVLAAVILVSCAPAPEVAPPPAPAVAPPTQQTAQVSPAPQAEPEIPAPVRELQAKILAAHGAQDAVASLTSEVGARLAGSPGDKRAVAWALEAMKARGLSNVRAEKVKVPVWQRGVETAELVAPVSHKLAVTAIGWSGRTPEHGLTGDLVRLESLEALEKADPETLKGKIAFVDLKMKPGADGSGYGDAVPVRGRGPEVAAKKGALAIVIRSIGTDASRFPHTGSMRRPENPASMIPAGALSNADADLVARVLAAHGSAQLTLTLTPRVLPDAESANVIGEIVGREKPDEIVLLGAHLDSWDLGEGAIDDGAGCGIVLEAGRAIAALPGKPRRTVRVVLFAAEENSLAGGKEYARAHAAEAPHTLAALEADLGTGRVVRARAHVGEGAWARFTTLAPWLTPLGVSFSERHAYGGADVGPLAPLGVPMIDLEQDATGYFDTHHTANDTLARVDAAALAQASAAFATAAWGLAEMRDDLGRIQGDAGR